MSPHLRFALSGWDYPHWVGTVYPPGRSVDRLRAVIPFCDTIEIAATHQRIPSRESVVAWSHVGTFEGIRFTAVAPKGILERNGERDALRFRDALAPLAEANLLLAAIVVLPQHLHWTQENARRLKEAIDRLAPWRVAVEMRHASWRTEKVLDWMSSHDIVPVDVDQPTLPGAMPQRGRLTGAFGLARLHGRNRATWFATILEHEDERHDYVYSCAELEPWAYELTDSSPSGAIRLVTACNAFAGSALGTLAKLRALCGESSPPCPAPLVERDRELAELGVRAVPIVPE